MRTAPPYRKEGDTWLVELRLGETGELFNRLDPSPFHRSDIAPEAERYIVAAAAEFPPGAPLALVIHLPRGEIHDDTAGRLQAAVRHYFTWETDNAAMRLRKELREGRTALMIGTAFLSFCMVLRALLGGDDVSLWRDTLAEGLLVIGWVAMWRPVDTFLYAWWPLRRRLRMMRKLAALSVSVQPY